MKPRPCRALACLGLICAGLGASTAQAEHQPRWELGAGVLAAQLPDYPGADQSRLHLVPYPYLIYRGDRVRVDGDGVRGLLLDHPQLKLDLSANASVAVSSDDNRARDGMPDLDYTFELGPSLQWRFRSPAQAQGRWRLDLPLRAVFSTDFSGLEHRGWVFSPNLSYRWRWPLLPSRPMRLAAAVGPLFGSADYHDYVYGVDAGFATPARPAYSAPAGYSGSRILISAGQDLNDRVLLGAFVRYDRLDGAAFDASPLLRRDDSLMFGVALTWVWARSAETVDHDPDNGRIPASIE